MIDEEYINRSYDCPRCNESGMTEREFITHSNETHPEEYPFSDMFPQYYVCECGDGELSQDVYMLATSENGPYYIVGEHDDFVDLMHPFDLYRHDWQIVLREETPFPKFEK